MDGTNGSRSRRKVSRVNYAEDSTIEETAENHDASSSSSSASTAVSITGKAKPGRRSAGEIKRDRDQVTDNFPLNWQRRIPAGEKISSTLDYTDARVEDGILYLKDGTTLEPEEHIYVLAEPPGEPYYIGRIMEFVPRDKSKTLEYKEGTDAVIDHYWARVNWLYRPSDVSKKSLDSRMLFLTMYSDLCPLQSFRGKCTVQHLEHIENLQKYRATPNCFWFDKLYDRYITRLFDVIPTEKVLNLPKRIYEILTDRYRFIIIEVGKGKEICSQPQYCNKCNQWCSPEDSVSCFHCKVDYHMLCVDPPITKRPPRGFGWSCAACNGELERKLEEGKGLKSNRMSTNAKAAAAAAASAAATASDTTAINASEPASSGVTSPSKPTSSTHSSESPPPMSRYKELEMAYEQKISLTLSQEQQHLLKMWPFRYFGMHSHIEDLLEIDDYIFPRAASRVSPKHQASVSDWPGRPVVYIEQDKTEKRGRKKMANRKTATTAASAASTPTTPTEPGSRPLSETDHFQSMPKKDRPPWVQVKPAGYIERGSEKTSTLMWKANENDDPNKVNEFLKKTGPYAQKLKIEPHSPNFMDTCLKAYMDNNYDETAALNSISSVQRKTIKEPTFTADEKARFEEGVRKYGSELHEVFKEVRTKKSADIVRYYYLWKKTPKGHEIWGNFKGRRSKKKPDTHNHVSHTGLIDEIADNSDDSAYDNDKAKAQKRSFVCKFCETTSSRVWRRAPGYPKCGSDNPVVALCIRCAKLWRRYAVVWEDPDEVMKKVAQKGTGGWKRKVEEELIEDSKAIFAEREKERERENTRKKMKLEKQQKEKGAQAAVAAVVASKSNVKPSIKEENDVSMENAGDSVQQHTPTKDESAPPVIPPPPSQQKEQPKLQPQVQQPLTQPQSQQTTNSDEQSLKVILRRCAVCNQFEPVPQHLFCQSCGLNVHTKCYGSQNPIPNGSWLCDPCSNDLKPLVSTLYACNLCPVREITESAITAETPGASDALKRTADNNWAHIRCAVWTRETKFGDISKLQPVEGISSIPKERFEQKCSICGTMSGACVKCGCCSEVFHIGCAGRKGFAFGFTLEPKTEEVHEDDDSDDEDQENGKVVTFGGRTGKMSAVILCSDHTTNISELLSLYEVDPSTGKTAFEIYCHSYKASKVETTGAMGKSLLYSSHKQKGKKTVNGETANVTLVLSDSGKYVDEVVLKSSVHCTRCNNNDSVYWIEQRGVGIACPKCFWLMSDPAKYEEAYVYHGIGDGISIGDREGTQRFHEMGNYALRTITSKSLSGLNETARTLPHQPPPPPPPAHILPQPTLPMAPQFHTVQPPIPTAGPREMRTSVNNLLNPLPEAPPPAPSQQPTTASNGNSNGESESKPRRTGTLDDILI